MKIAEPIQTLEYLRDSGVFSFSTKEGVLYTVESIDVAIETMKKYQKIEQILDDCDLEAWEVLEEIKKVVEDGNVNNRIHERKV